MIKKKVGITASKIIIPAIRNRTRGKNIDMNDRILERQADATKSNVEETINNLVYRIEELEEEVYLLEEANTTLENKVDSLEDEIYDITEELSILKEDYEELLNKH